MRAHIVENGTVTNTIEVEALDFMPNLVEATEGGIGWTYNGSAFFAPVEDEKAKIKADIAALEEKATPRRTREAILGTDNGWLADIENQIQELRGQL